MANSSSCGAEHIARARALSNGMLTQPGRRQSRSCWVAGTEAINAPIKDVPK
jgi:hypothetical protein